MAEKMNPPPGSDAADDEARDMRNALARRLAVAGGLVAILLGLLGVFEHFSQAPEDDEAPVFTRPVPVAPKKLVTQPLTPADDLPEPPVTATAPAPADASPATPTATAPGTVEPITTGPRGVAANENPPDSKKVPAAASTATATTVPATSPATPAATPRAASEARPVPARQPAVVPEKTISPPLAPPDARPTPPPPEPATAPVAAVPPAPARIVDVVPGGSAIARPGAGFVLQAGVFTSAERAEELHARLSLNGIPSAIETRVQVGPFRTRQEAMAAQRKLRELGVDSLLITPKVER